MSGRNPRYAHFPAYAAADKIVFAGGNAFGLVARQLRKTLFAMTGDASSATAGVAEACLAAIDELRDEYGASEFEPRHPDVESGRPWPPANVRRGAREDAAP